MNVRPLAIVASSVASLGICGCGNSVHSCGVGDYASTGQHGFAMPKQVLRSVLAVNPSLAQDGWRRASRGASAVEFLSGDDSVEVVKRSDGRWVIGAVTNCR
jgi:hypothetical protein